VTDELAYKYRMSSLQAAFGRAQLARLAELIERKQQIFSWYEDRLASHPALQLNHRQPGVVNSFWMVTVVIDEALGLATRDLMQMFDDQLIDTRPFFPPLSSLGAFSNAVSAQGASERNPVAYDISSRSISLPSALALTEQQVDRVSGCLLEILRGAGSSA